MKVNIKNNWILALILMISCSAFGQSRLDKIKSIPAEDMAEKRTELIKEKLNLSAEQTEAVYQINLEASKKRKEVFNNSSMFSMRKKLKPIKAEVTKEMKSVLTEEQFAIYEDESFKKELKSKMENWIDNQ